MSKAAKKESGGPPGGGGEWVAAAVAAGELPAAGEMPEDLKAAGWALKEHEGDGGQFKCKNARLKLATTAYNTPFEAFEAARRLQAKEDGHAPVKPPAGPDDEGRPAPAGAVSRRFTMRLKVQLKAEGLQAKCIELDAACAEKEQMEASFERVKDKFKEDLKEKQAEVDALLHVVRHQHVETEVECEERMVYDEKRVVVVRLDTDTEVESRDMTPQELQQKLIAI